jgi:hypothetical protein
MAATLQVISGVVVLDKKVGHAEVDFDEGIITGDVNVDTSDVRGPRRNFRSAPHVLVSPSRLTLSTRDNTSYSITRSVTSEKLTINWNIDSAGLKLQIDFLVIGESR